MIPDKLYQLTLLVIFVIAIIQIINLFKTNPMVIEAKYEHLNPALLTHQVENLAEKPSDNSDISFYLKENRYDAANKYNPKLQGVLISDPRLSCGPKFDWETKHLPGANNTYGDLVWHQTEPKNVLQQNCLNCNHYMPPKQYNEPVGITSEITSAYGSQTEPMALDDQMKMNNLGTAQVNDLLYQRQVGDLKKDTYLPPVLNYKSTCAN